YSVASTRTRPARSLCGPRTGASRLAASRPGPLSSCWRKSAPPNPLPSTCTRPTSAPPGPRRFWPTVSTSMACCRARSTLRPSCSIPVSMTCATHSHQPWKRKNMTRKNTEQLHLGAFIVAGPGRPGGWRHPQSEDGWLTPDYYRRIAQTLEQGRFDLAFFPDILAVPNRFGGSHESQLRYGALGSLRLEPT